MSDAISKGLLERAERLMPGGVNSPVRAFRAVGGKPVFVKEAHGSRLVGADGKEYIDYVCSWGPAILGHADTNTVLAVREVAGKGLSFGAPTELEVRFAEAIVARYPSIEMLRCVSSGTEATLSALRLARGYTGRDIIVKFDGGYHGHASELLVAAGSGAATFGNPDSAGVPRATVEHTATLSYNDSSALRALFAEKGSQIAAVIVEPVAGNMGCVPPEPGFLESILALCQEHGALSIFDEVMTGSRLAPGGAQQRYGLSPDLTCLGKVVGGGMPLAVYGGKAEIMRKVAPLGPVYQAGTLSGNPVAVTAGLTTLEQLTADKYETLERLGAKLESGLIGALRETGAVGCVQRVGSMLTLFFQEGPVRNYRDSARSDKQRFAKWHQGLLRRGVHWPASCFEAAFLSTAHSDDDIALTVEAAKQALLD